MHEGYTEGHNWQHSHISCCYTLWLQVMLFPWELQTRRQTIMQTCTSNELKSAFAAKRTIGQVLSYMSTYAKSCHSQLAKTAASLAKHHTNCLANGPFRESTHSFQVLHASIRFVTNTGFQQQMLWLCNKMRIVLRATIRERTKPFIAEHVAFNELSLEQHTTPHGSIGPEDPDAPASWEGADHVCLPMEASISLCWCERNPACSM